MNRVTRAAGLSLGWPTYWLVWLVIVLTFRPYDLFMRWDHQTWTRDNMNSEGNKGWLWKDHGQA